MNHLGQSVGELVRRAAQECRFYRGLYARHGVDLEQIQTEEDLRLLPIVTPQDLMEHADGFRALGATVYRVTCSSGTVQTPKVLYRTERDTSESAAVMCRLFEMAGVRAGDSLWIGQPFDLAHLGYITLLACQRLGVLALPGGLSITDTRMLAGLRRHQPSVVFTSPSRMLQLAARLAETGERSWPLRRVLLAGEPCHPDQADRIRDFFAVAPHLLYGSEESDGLAGSCDARRGLHFMADRVHLDLVTPGGSEAVAPGEPGEAVITSLYAEGTPLIRYRLGDLIAPLAGPCACGAQWPLVQVLGRASQTFFLYDGIKLYGHQLRSVLSRFAAPYQAVLRSTAAGREEIEIILPDSLAGDTEVLKQIVEGLWMCSSDLAAARDIGSLEFRVTPSGRFLITPRGKTPEFVDLRGERSMPEQGDR